MDYRTAETSEHFRNMLIDHLDVLTILYRDLLERNVDNDMLINDNEQLNKCVSEMFVITDHLIPKLKGSGDMNRGILDRLIRFRELKKQPLELKADLDNRKIVHDIWDAILEAYDILGLSSY